MTVLSWRGLNRGRGTAVAVAACCAAVFVGAVALKGSAALEPVGDEDTQISSMGPAGDPAFEAINGDIVADPRRGEFIVVWHGDDNSGQLVEGKVEVWGRRVSEELEPLGEKFRVSFSGLDFISGVTSGRSPAAAYNSERDELFVAWASTGSGGLPFGDREIRARRLTATGDTVGSSVLISSMGLPYPRSRFHKGATAERLTSPTSSTTL